MEEAPAGTFSGPTIQVVLQYLISVSMKEIKRVGEFKKEKLKSTFIMIQNILDDAEMHQADKRAVKLWLKKLEYVSFRADNVLDEFYKHLRKTKSAKKKKLEPFFSGSNFRDHRLKLIRKIRDINIVFGMINQEASSIGLETRIAASGAAGSDAPASLETDSFIEMLNSILTEQEQLCYIIPIVWMGGLGNTTLTRKVFRHEKIKTYFGTQIWVHVSKSFDPVILLKKILTALTSENVEVGNKFCNLLPLDKNFGYMGNLEVNSSNKKGLTPLDVLVCEGGDCEIEEMLTLAAGGAITGAMSPQNSVVATQSHNQSAAQEQRGDRPKSAYNKLLDYFKFDRSKDSLSEVRNALLVTAVLIATVTYQAVLTPPGGVWQDDSWPIAKNNTSRPRSSHHPTPLERRSWPLTRQSLMVYA